MGNTSEIYLLTIVLIFLPIFLYIKDENEKEN